MENPRYRASNARTGASKVPNAKVYAKSKSLAGEGADAALKLISGERTNCSRRCPFSKRCATNVGVWSLARLRTIAFEGARDPKCRGSKKARGEFAFALHKAAYALPGRNGALVYRVDGRDVCEGFALFAFGYGKTGGQWRSMKAAVLQGCTNAYDQRHLSEDPAAGRLSGVRGVGAALHRPAPAAGAAGGAPPPAPGVFLSDSWGAKLPPRGDNATRASSSDDDSGLLDRSDDADDADARLPAAASATARPAAVKRRRAADEPRDGFAPSSDGPGGGSARDSSSSWRMRGRGLIPRHAAIHRLIGDDDWPDEAAAAAPETVAAVAAVSAAERWARWRAENMAAVGWLGGGFRFAGGGAVAAVALYAHQGGRLAAAPQQQGVPGGTLQHSNQPQQPLPSPWQPAQQQQQQQQQPPQPQPDEDPSSLSRRPLPPPPPPPPPPLEDSRASPVATVGGMGGGLTSVAAAAVCGMALVHVRSPPSGGEPPLGGVAGEPKPEQTPALAAK